MKRQHLTKLQQSQDHFIVFKCLPIIASSDKITSLHAFSSCMRRPRRDVEKAFETKQILSQQKQVAPLPFQPTRQSGTRLSDSEKENGRVCARKTITIATFTRSC